MAASRQQRSLPPSRRLTRFGRTATRNSSEPHARALRRLHNDVAHPWSVEELAKEAGLSRSVFSERFGQKVGVPPMQYLMDWRMALAKAAGCPSIGSRCGRDWLSVSKRPQH